MNAEVEGKERPTDYALVQTQLVLPVERMPLSAEEIINTPAVYSTIDVSKPEDALRMYDLMVEGGGAPDKIINTPVTITGVVVHPVQFADGQTGELIRVPSTVLLTKEHGPIQFFSLGIWSSITWMRLAGIAPFGKLKQQMVLKQVTVSDNKRMYQLHRAASQSSRVQ